MVLWENAKKKKKNFFSWPVSWQMTGGSVLSTLGAIHKWRHFFPPLQWPLPLLQHHLILPIRILTLILDLIDLVWILDLFLPKIFWRHLWRALSCHLSWKVLSVSWFMQTLLGIKVWWGMKLLPRFMVYLLLWCTRRNFYSDKIVGPLTRLMLWLFNLTNFFVNIADFRLLKQNQCSEQYCFQISTDLEKTG